MVKNCYILAVFLAVLSVGCVEQIEEKVFGKQYDIEAPQMRTTDFWRYNNCYKTRRIELLKAGCNESEISYKSMIPTIGCNHTILVKSVKNNSELLSSISVGDIIVFSKESDSTQLDANHRIVYEGHDEQGRYFITKGDNNKVTDEEWYGKVRESEIIYVVVGVRY